MVIDYISSVLIYDQKSLHMSFACDAAMPVAGAGGGRDVGRQC